MKKKVDSTITTNRIGGAVYVGVPGALNTAESTDALSKTLSTGIAARANSFLVDLGRVSLIDGAALALLLNTQTKLLSLGGNLKLANLNAVVTDALLATGVGEHFDVINLGAGETTTSWRRKRSKLHTAPAAGPRKKLGEILLAMGVLNQTQLDEAFELQPKLKKKLGNILVAKGFVSSADLLKALSVQLGIPYIPLRPGLYEPAAIALLPKKQAERLQVLPMFVVNDTLTIATADPLSVPVFDEVEQHAGRKVRLVLSQPEDITKALHDGYGDDIDDSDWGAETAADLEILDTAIEADHTKIDELASGSPVINLVNSLINRAIRDKASDIHIETSRTRSRVRFRIDGLLYEVMAPRHDLHPAIVSRLKVMANMDIAERRMPQDGRIQVSTKGRAVDLRFSSLPGIFGEKVVLRVLDKDHSILDINKIGMTDQNLERFKKLLARSHGLILVTGPTGSGKTTTLYAAINHLKSIEKNIVTIEEPVEYQVDIVNQNQVNDAIGLTYPKMLKHILRQDPDIIMVGEIRDEETARIAVQAALTGHLVLSTLHTNDALSAVSRLMDMGVEPYLLASAVIGVVAQRLIRQICSECKTTYLATPEIVAAHGWDPAATIKLARGRGCPACYDSGHKGRFAIHELLQADSALSRLIAKGASRDELQAHVKNIGHKDLVANGLERVLEERTTPEEVARVIHSE